MSDATIVTKMAAMAGLACLIWGLYRHRATTLRSTLAWACAAWAAWAWVAFAEREPTPRPSDRLAEYLALCLTACSSVAVLGARRPGVGAWNFVIAGLLSVLLLPVAQGFGEPRPHLSQAVFLMVVVGVGVLNYLPTRLGPAALAVAVGCAPALLALGEVSMARDEWSLLLVHGAPALGALGFAAAPAARSEFDRCWLGFRNSFGLLWALRMRDQFNRAAANAGWPVQLGWSGLRPENLAPADAEKALLMLRALLQRFTNQGPLDQ